jgi:hypothetical protein
MRTPTLLALVLSALVAGACGEGAEGPSPGPVTGPSGGTTSPSPTGTTPTPTGSPTPAPAPGEPGSTQRIPTVAGTYQMSTFIDLTQLDLFGDLASTSLRALSGLADTPGATLIALLRAANVPILSTILGALPGPLASAFTGWLDDVIKSTLYRNVPAVGQIAQLVDDIATIATKFELLSTIQLNQPSGDGESTGSHTVNGTAFTVGGRRIQVTAPAAVSQVARASNVYMFAAPIWSNSARIEDARLVIGDHAFGLPIGTFVQGAINQILMQRFGAANLSAALNQVLSCSAIATELGNKCVGPACVRSVVSVAQLTQLCQSALGLVASQTEMSISRLNIDLLRFSEGEGKMWDAPAAGGAEDNVISRIDDGAWAVAIRTGTAPAIPLVSPFTGTRVGN